MARAEMPQGLFVGSTTTTAYICGSVGPHKLDHKAEVEQSLLLHQCKMSKCSSTGSSRLQREKAMVYKEPVLQGSWFYWSCNREVPRLSSITVPATTSQIKCCSLVWRSPSIPLWKLHFCSWLSTLPGSSYFSNHCSSYLPRENVLLALPPSCSEDSKITLQSKHPGHFDHDYLPSSLCPPFRLFTCSGALWASPSVLAVRKHHAQKQVREERVY